MKLLASAAALLCVAVAVAAAPALSTSPYRPRAVDFEVAPPHAAASAAGGAVTSRRLRPGRRFNLVGMRWRGRARPRIAIRTRRSGGRWTRWIRLDSEADDGPDAGSREARRSAAVSAPAWVGEADELQYRLSRRVPGLRLHFVNVLGTASPGARRLTALRRAANAAVVSAGRLLGAAPARAQEPQPGMVPRADWGASQCPPREAPIYGSVKAAYVHHTVNSNDYTPEEAPAIVLAICRFHRNSNGWNDIGYNFLVDRYGTIYEGRAGGIDQPVVGAQAQGYNAQTTGIANIGTFEDVGQSPEALDAMARLIRWKLPLHGAPTTGPVTLVSAGGASNRYPSGRAVTIERIAGHRDTNATACPGSALYAQLPQLRAMAAGAAPLPGATTVLTAAPAALRVTYGGTVAFSGDLRDTAGVPVPGATIQVQVRRSGRWKTTRLARTASDGTFTASLRPRASVAVRARFPGGGGLRASSSPAAQLRLRPLITVSRAPGRGARGIRVRVRGSVAPAKRLIHLVLQLRRGGVYRRVGVSAWRVRRGRYRASFVPAGAGVYRFYLVAKGDRATDRGASPAQLVTVSRFAGAAPARR
jgi:hypothetical protein